MIANRRSILEMLGDPRDVDRELADFRKTASAFSSDHPRLISRYPKQWIAVYKGKVRATGRTLRSVLSRVDAEGLPRDRVIVRFIDENQRTMIL